MEKKKAKCVNIECTAYDKVIELDTATDNVCPECGSVMEPVTDEGGTDGGGHKGRNLAIALAAVALLGGGGFGIYSMMGDKDKAQPAPVVQPVDTVKNDTAVAEPVVAEPVAEEPVAAEPVAAKPVVKKPLNGRGTINLGYATYTGDLKNGKPHGYGVLTYRQSHRIVPSKDFYAEPGDTFEGDFRDGKISGLGYWKHNGNQTAVKP